jgi:hypothetical protein
VNKLYSTALACLLPLAAQADPSSATKDLMHEPASMLDLGLYKLEGNVNELIQESLPSLGITAPVHVRAIYAFGPDQIQVVLAVAQTVPDAKETCRRLVTTVQSWMHSSPVWTEDFMHSGYTEHQQRDEALKAKLAEMILIEARVIPNPVSANSSAMRAASASCSGTLGTAGVTYTAR